MYHTIKYGKMITKHTGKFVKCISYLNKYKTHSSSIITNKGRHYCLELNGVFLLFVKQWKASWQHGFTAIYGQMCCYSTLS